MTASTQRPALPTQCFAASNSCEGFKNYYNEIFTDTSVDRLYVIKGGPGTGKSHFMRVVARHARERGYAVTRYLCSSDPTSLDGLLLSKEGCPTLGLLDGTPPHVREPAVPGARDEIVNLGAFWDPVRLAADRDTITALGRLKSTSYGRAYAALSAAGRMDEVADSLTEGCVDHSRIAALANRLLGEQPTSSFSTAPALRRAVSMGGKHTIHSFEASACRLLLPDEGYGLGYYLTAAMLEVSKKRGHGVLVSYHPVYPRKIDGLYYPDTGLCVLVGDAEPPEGIPVRSLSMRRYTDGQALREVRGELRRTAALREELTETALRHLAVAAKHHFELERIYAEAMDFTAKEAYTERFCGEVLEG